MGSSASIIPLIVIISILVSISYGVINQYEMVNSSYWRSISDFTPKPATSFGTIKLLHSLRLEFDFVLHDRFDYHHWQNIFRIGFKSKNNSCSGYGSRYPSLWLVPSQNHLHLSLSQVNNCHYGPWPNFPIQMDIIYKIIIEFNDSWVYLKINDNIHINEERPSPSLNNVYNQDLNVWISTDRYIERPMEHYNATLRNIIIHSWDPLMATFNPTQYPTNDPSGFPTSRPTPLPSHLPMMEPTTMEPTIIIMESDINSWNETSDTDTEIGIFVDDDSMNEENNGISQQSIYFFIIGALLASICCVCMIGTSLGIICYIKKKKKRKHKLGLNYVNSLSKKEHRGNILKLRNNGLYQHDSSPNQSDEHDDKYNFDITSHDVDVIYESEENERDIIFDENEEEKHHIHHQDMILNDKDSNEKSYNTESEEEGAFDQMIFGEGGADKDLIDVVNRKQTVEEKFAGMLNDANAVNDIMLNDVIDEMETAGMEKYAEKSSSNHLETP